MLASQVPEAMKDTFYPRLERMGFTWKTRTEPDEWKHADGREVRIIHVSRRCEISFRADPERSWTQRFRPTTEGTTMDFQGWLARTADLIRACQ